MAPRAHWLAVEWLSIEPVWRDLKANRLAYQTFADADGFETDDLETAIHRAVRAISNKPRRYPLAKLQISA
ncbi:MAG: hypothetical protein ACREDD_08490 [Methylocella sp.]